MLINTNETLKSILGGIQKEMAWKTWGPFVRDAENSYIIPAIGQELYDELNALVSASQDTVSGSAPQQALVLKLRATIGHYTELESILSMMLIKGDGGIAVSSAPNMQAPGKWAIVGKMAESRDKADRHMESALQFLETNKMSFPTWTASSSYTISHSLFLASATQYSQYLPAIRDSRRLYVALRGYISKSESDFIMPLIGQAQFAHWKSKLTDGAVVWTDPELEALALLRTALANDAFKRAIPYLNLSADFRLISETDGIRNEDLLSDAKLSAIRSDVEKESAEYANRLKRLMDKKASTEVFPQYYNSDLFAPAKRKTYQPPLNCDVAVPFVL